MPLSLGDSLGRQVEKMISDEQYCQTWKLEKADPFSHVGPVTFLLLTD